MYNKRTNLLPVQHKRTNKLLVFQQKSLCGSSSPLKEETGKRLQQPYSAATLISPRWLL